MELAIINLVRDILDKLPIGMTGIIVTVLGGLYIHKSKRFPWKITRVGTNGSTQITADMLKKNCLEYHLPINENITKIYDRQTEVLSKMSNIEGYLQGKFGKEKVNQ